MSAGIERAELRVAIELALVAELGDTYDCNRVWEAWGYGTMDEDDFVPVLDRLDGLIDTIEVELRKAQERPVCIVTSREVMRAGGVDPDAPFDPGPFPVEMRQSKADVAAWLIERHDMKGGTHYFAQHDTGHWWTNNIGRAERFADEETARLCCKGGDIDGPLRVYEHKWITS